MKSRSWPMKSRGWLITVLLTLVAPVSFLLPSPQASGVLVEDPNTLLINERFTVNGRSPAPVASPGNTRGVNFGAGWWLKHSEGGAGQPTGSAAVQRISPTRGGIKLSIENAKPKTFHYLRQTLPNVTQHSEKTYTAVVDVEGVDTSNNADLLYDFYINARWNNDDPTLPCVAGKASANPDPAVTYGRVCLHATNPVLLADNLVAFQFAIGDLRRYKVGSTEADNEGLEFAFRVITADATPSAEVTINSISLYEDTATSWRTLNSNGLVESDHQGSDRLTQGQTLYPGQYLLSPDGSYGLLFQQDQNIVLVGGEDNSILWSSRTNGSGANRLVMQHDGNLVAYANRKPVWAITMLTSGGQTPDSPYKFKQVAGSLFRVQNDGNLVVYSPSGRPLWASKTSYGTVAGTKISTGSLLAGQTLGQGEYIADPTTTNKLKLTVHGELAVYGPGNIKLWSTGTNDGQVLRMSVNGVLELLNRQGSVVWSSTTDGQKEQIDTSSLRVQYDGNVVIYSPSGSGLWSTSTNYR